MMSKKENYNVPEGWVLVPVVPTPAMEAAGRQMADECKDGDTDVHAPDGLSIYSTEYLTYDAPAKIFRAMVEAAPGLPISPTHATASRGAGRPMQEQVLPAASVQPDGRKSRQRKR